MSEKHRKEIESLLNKSEPGVNKRLQKLYKELAEETTQDIIKLAKEIEETDKFSKKLQKERLEAIRSQMYTKANQLEGTQKENIYDFLRHDGQVAFNELFYDFEMTEKIPLSFTMLTDKQINVIINTPVANRKLSTRLKGNNTKMKQNLNRVLTRGFAKGLSTQKMAVQIAEIGGANYRRAMNIARTESGRVTSVARQQSQNHAKSIGLKLEKQWISTLDKLTRSNHQILDGKRIDIDAYFEVSGHKALQPHMFGVASEDCNCRCRTITIVNGMGPELRKENESKEVGEYKNYEEWLANKKSDGKEKDNNQVKEIVEKIKVNETIKNNLQKEINLEKEIEELSKTPKNVDYKKEHRRLREALEEQYDDGEIDDDEYNAGLAELRERFKRSNLTGDMKDNSDKMISLKNQLLELQESNAIKNADIIKSELAKYREMGVPSDVDMKKHLTKPNSRASKIIAKAYDYYPTDWVRKSAEHGIIDVGTAKRGYYSAGFKELRLSGARGKRNSFRTALHELGHRMEDVDKAILERERQFYEYRTKGETLQSLKKLKGGNYKENEGKL